MRFMSEHVRSSVDTSSIYASRPRATIHNYACKLTKILRMWSCYTYTFQCVRAKIIEYKFRNALSVASVLFLPFNVFAQQKKKKFYQDNDFQIATSVLNNFVSWCHIICCFFFADDLDSTGYGISSSCEIHYHVYTNDAVDHNLTKMSLL